MKSNIFSNKVASVLFAVIVSILWGTLYPMIKIGYKVFEIDNTAVSSILLFAGVRFLISGIILVSMCSAKSKKLELPTGNKFIAVFIVSLLTVEQSSANGCRGKFCTTMR